MKVATDPLVNQLLDDLVDSLKSLLGEKLIGLYLYGSLVLFADFFDHNTSDIDLLAALSADLNDEELVALKDMHRDLVRDNPDWEDRVDVAYVPVAALRTFRSARTSMAIVSPGEPFHTRNQERVKDWLQNWYLIREGGVTLFGPPPKEIIPAITHEEFVQAVRDYALALSQEIPRDRKSQAYLVLTLCRSLHVERTGKHVSKKEGALWVQKEFPEWSELIQGALAWREEQADPAGTYAETSRFANVARAQLLRVGGS